MRSKATAWARRSLDFMKDCRSSPEPPSALLVLDTRLPRIDLPSRPSSFKPRSQPRRCIVLPSISRREKPSYTAVRRMRTQVRLLTGSDQKALFQIFGRGYDLILGES